jgi:hypothetical protein
MSSQTKGTAYSLQLTNSMATEMIILQIRVKPSSENCSNSLIFLVVGQYVSSSIVLNLHHGKYTITRFRNQVRLISTHTLDNAKAMAESLLHQSLASFIQSSSGSTLGYYLVETLSQTFLGRAPFLTRS